MLRGKGAKGVSGVETTWGGLSPAGKGQFVANQDQQHIPTRQTLLSRLKDLDDGDSWKVFFDTYWNLIYTAALRAGLTDTEAQEVVQETVIAASKSMPNFKYDPALGSFKSWLLKLTHWRIVDQFRKRQPWMKKETKEGTDETATVDKVADPASPDVTKVWEEEWSINLFKVALERVKKKVDPRHYQIFDLYVLQNWPVMKVSKSLQVNPGRIYLVKHRLSALIKQEMRQLDKHEL